ncbi:hypothetical protein [Streptomyces sp. MUSC 125]|uniref:hypothetical protein n=1 Tax=Streptomyces sp. MUSC 125 TaxID=1428624 RepID=UPI000ADA5D1D|nr:hypothetical protein [Streptomyces sp. MUSC 125]
MEGTGVGAVVVFLVVVCAPGLGSVLHSIAFRIRAAGKAELGPGLPALSPGAK